MTATTNVIALQWGRDLLIAEIGAGLEEGAPDTLLQWGRDLLIAEMRQFPALPDLITKMLQWGRDLLIAEMEAIAKGAADATLLQWGRDLLIAEICRLGRG